MNKKLEDIRIQALLYFIATYIICIIIWPLLDMLWCAIISHSEFHYSPMDHLVEPIFFSVIITLFFYVPVAIKARKSSKTTSKKTSKSKK